LLFVVIGDIGGTHLRVAASTVSDSFEEPVVYDTPPDFTVASSTFAEAVARAAAGRPVERAIIGIAGLVAPDHATLLRSPHLRGWEHRNISQAFSHAIGSPVYIENDAMLGGLGEAVRGAGIGASIVAYITVGTGLGGARIVDGKIDRNACGFEIGHQLLGVSLDAPEWELLVSGSGLALVSLNERLERNRAQKSLGKALETIQEQGQHGIEPRQCQPARLYQVHQQLGDETR
jgi:predicted NBD/HSP70 family sugar kinase